MCPGVRTRWEELCPYPRTRLLSPPSTQLLPQSLFVPSPSSSPTSCLGPSHRYILIPSRSAEKRFTDARLQTFTKWATRASRMGTSQRARSLRLKARLCKHRRSARRRSAVSRSPSCLCDPLMSTLSSEPPHPCSVVLTPPVSSPRITIPDPDSRTTARSFARCTHDFLPRFV